jgi:signal peptidase I
MSATSAVSQVRIDSTEPFVSPALDAALPVAEKMRSQGSACLRVSGGSMTPWMRSGDFVFIRRSEFARISAGDVIVFYRNGLLVVHRTIRRIKGSPSEKIASLLITKGDAADEVDALVSEQEYLGRVTRLHRGRRHIDLESFTQKLLARLLARISRLSRVIYFPLRFANRLLFR